MKPLQMRFSSSQRWTRRSFVAAGVMGLGSLGLAGLPIAAAKDGPDLAPFARYADLLDRLEKRGHRLRILGSAPDKSPIVAVKSRGKKQPAIFISAGSHSTEHAGVAGPGELAR